MSGVVYLRQSTVNLPLVRQRFQAATSGVTCGRDAAREDGTHHLVDVTAANPPPQCSAFSGILRSLSAAHQSPKQKLRSCCVSAKSAGSFRSPNSEEDNVDGAPAPVFTFSQVACCRSSGLTGNGRCLAAEVKLGCCVDENGDHEIQPITVYDLASSLSSAGNSWSEGEARTLPVAAIVDCRAFVAYNVNHVVSAFNASCADRIARKRLMSGKATVADFVSGGDLPETEKCVPRDCFKRLVEAAAADGRAIVVYDDNATCMTSVPATHPLRLVTDCLKKSGVAVKFLQGGLQAFYAAYPQLCSSPDSTPSRPMLYSPTTPVVEMDVDSAEMSQVLPFLFIGNERDAANRDLLHQSMVSHVLNVTSHVPQHFEDDVSMTYKRLAATDTCSQNLKQYFDDAITFIESARRAGGRVLVHCQAGVSRSPTVVIAYLMARFDWNMMTAFDFVKSRRSVVAPNLHFMGQLLEFESNCTTSAGAAALQRCQLTNNDDGSSTLSENSG